MPTKYTAEELREASNRVMRSLNMINAKPARSLSKPAIPNSLGRASGVTKSARKRQNRKARSNIGGKTMENLLDVLPEAPKPLPLPASAEELQAKKIKKAEANVHRSRKAEQKVVQHEIATFKRGASLGDIRAKLEAMNKRPPPEDSESMEAEA